MAGMNLNPEWREEAEFNNSVGRIVAQAAARATPNSPEQYRNDARNIVEQVVGCGNWMVFAWRIEEGRIVQEHTVYNWPDDDFPKAWTLSRDKMMEIRADKATKVLAQIPPPLSSTVPVAPVILGRADEDAE
jgi:hypothetical protein